MEPADVLLLLLREGILASTLRMNCELLTSLSSSSCRSGVFSVETVEIVSNVAPRIQRRFFGIELGVAPSLSTAQSSTLLVYDISIAG
jgi:hypothetical protein